METTSFLGRGWSFPPTFNRAGRMVEMDSDEEDIRSSLHILLTTRVGERIMQPDYGCNLDDMVFENLDLTLKTYIIDLIETAILYHEPRIDVESISLKQPNPGEGLILIEIVYRVRTTNSRFNFVFPFYKNEGSNL